jgi:hypothetical protein
VLNLKLTNRRVVKKCGVLLLASALLRVAACASTTSTEPWWKGKPVSQMAPAEREEQDPEFWFFWGHLHGLGE